MKTIKKTTILVSAVTLLFLISCNKEEVFKNLILGKEKVELIEGTTENVVITEREGDVTAVSSKKEVVEVSVVAEKVVIKAKSAGKATVTVKDSRNTKVIEVTVKGILNLEKSEAKAFVGKDAFVAINNGTGNYKVEGVVDATKLKAVVEGGKLKLTGVAVTENPIEVTVLDTDTKKKVTVKVTVAEVVKLELKEGASSYMPVTEKKSVGVGAEVFVKIITGNEGYKITGVDDAKLKAEVVEKVYKELNTTTWKNEEVKRKAIKITGKAEGEVALTITDEAGETTKLTVNVYPKIALAETTKSITACGEVTVDISAGSGKYSVSVDSKTGLPYLLAKVKDGKVVLIPKTNAKNDVKVTVKDDETELTEEITVTVTLTDIEENDSFYVTCTGELNKKEDGTVASGEVVVLEGAISVPYPAFGKDYVKPFVDNTAITSIDFKNIESIAAGALKGCTGLTKITLRKLKTVESLFGAWGAETYPDLKSVYCHMNPADVTVMDKAFRGLTKDAVLYVPAKYLEAYKTSKFADYFNKDTNIKAIQ